MALFYKFVVDSFKRERTPKFDQDISSALIGWTMGCSLQRHDALLMMSKIIMTYVHGAALANGSNTRKSSLADCASF